MGSLTDMAKNGGATNLKTFQTLLTSKKNTIIETLQSEVKFNKFRSNLVRLYDTTALKDCDPMSVLGAAMQVANLQLDLDPNLGQAYVLARWDNKNRCYVASFQIGYQGLLELARRSGDIKRIEAHTIWEKEKYEYFFDDEKGTVIKHFPLPPSQRGDNRVAAYFVAFLENGSVHKEWMWAEEVEYLKKESLDKIKPEYQKYSPWKSNFISEDAMWKKTAIRRGLKYLPKTSEIETIIALEDEESKGNLIDYSKVVNGEYPIVIPENQDDMPPKIEDKKIEDKKSEAKTTIVTTVKPKETVHQNVAKQNSTTQQVKNTESTSSNKSLFNHNPFDDDEDLFSNASSNETKLF